ncbi:ABC transporter permease subunit [Mesorhizobium sp. KR1-2]|uniref:amino acid ABC transporter permease n=1 Tax=Mesorhizobium sp. KR1-2 TaxID=3156609 RepID=UPI0032B3A5C5
MQVGLIAAVAIFVAFIVANLSANLERLNIAVGFGFLQRTAGFDIAQSLIPYPPSATYLRAFLAAFANTVLLAVVSISAATVLGLFIALARMSTNPLLSLVALGYIEAVRNIPLLLQLFFWYFSVLGPLPLPRQSFDLFGLVFLNKRGLSLPAPVAGPGFSVFLFVAAAALLAAWFLFRRARLNRIRSGRSSIALLATAIACIAVPLLHVLLGSPVSWEIPELRGLNLAGGVVVIPEFVAMAIGMTVYGSAFIAELIRGGVMTVGKGQTEAGMALGLSRARIYSKIIIPQVFRAIVPPLTGQYITLLKNSSLAAAIGYPDLMLIVAGTTLNQTGQPVEVMAIAMASYLLLNVLISLGGNVVNKRMQLVER